MHAEYKFGKKKKGQLRVCNCKKKLVLCHVTMDAPVTPSDLRKNPEVEFAFKISFAVEGPY